MTQKRIALIAHDNQKINMADWAVKYRDLLAKHDLCATGTTGKILEEKTGLQILKYKSGPLGGDQQIGARIAEGTIDLVIFFWDPMAPHPHDVDVKALLRIAVVYDVPIACNRRSADLMVDALIAADSARTAAALGLARKKRAPKKRAARKTRASGKKR